MLKETRNIHANPYLENSREAIIKLAPELWPHYLMFLMNCVSIQIA